MTLSKMDYWRLAGELSVIDAVILITGNDPSQMHDLYQHEDVDEYELVQTTGYEGFDATFKALRNAIFSNRLRATLAFKADNLAGLGDRRPAISALVRAAGLDLKVTSSWKLNTFRDAADLLVTEEPDWQETTVDVDDLKTWLAGKGLYPEFFFSGDRAEGFRDKKHHRYSPKLACAVAAWEAVETSKPNMSPKATIEEWVRANAATYEMVGSDGLPTNQAVDQVSSVVNWATGGGANPTSSPTRMEEAECGETEIQNFHAVHLDDEADEDPQKAKPVDRLVKPTSRY